MSSVGSARAGAGSARERGERGSATLLAVGVIGVLLMIGAALGVVAAMVHAHRIAQSAADLAALAAASAPEAGCDAAAGVAEANGAELTSCTLEGREAWVEVRVEGPRYLGQTGDLAARARAGPA